MYSACTVLQFTLTGQQCHCMRVCCCIIIVVVVARENALAKSGKPYAIALHSFRGGQSGDLPLVKGELIELTGSVGSDWLRGKAGNKEGIFPGMSMNRL